MLLTLLVPLAWQHQCPTKDQSCNALLIISCPCLPARPLASLPQANPEGALRQHPGLLAEFEAAPWLLPARTPALPYAKVHDFDALLKLRSQPVAGYNKSIALILFDKRWAVMTQNSSECSVPTPVFNDEAAVPRVSGACRHLSPSASARCCTTLLCMLGTHPPAFLAAFFTPR